MAFENNYTTHAVVLIEHGPPLPPPFSFRAPTTPPMPRFLRARDIFGRSANASDSKDRAIRRAILGVAHRFPSRRDQHAGSRREGTLLGIHMLYSPDTVPMSIARNSIRACIAEAEFLNAVVTPNAFSRCGTCFLKSAGGTLAPLCTIRRTSPGTPVPIVQIK